MSTQINPEDLDGLGGNMWDHVRREYLSGVKATHICQKWGISLSSFRMHARAGRWRRIDQPIGDVLPEAGEFHPEDEVSFADLADQAFLNIRRALGMGRASEASTWMRVYDRLCDRARAHVMADLPDIAPPRIESKREPLRLVGDGEGNVNDLNAVSETPGIDPQEIGLLAPGFFRVQSVTVSSPFAASRMGRWLRACGEQTEGATRFRR
ncbi:hypothetical protein [Brevundimonas subvibrioides]|uniref:hypothetical protein n=1 Tax=Brevundimonas subvibrioides TaxID=74313 RepID=UPI0032D58BA3